MTDHTDLIENLRSKINPAYADVIGTESYERKVCLDAIEALVKELDGWKACAENRLEIQRMREGQLAALRDAIEAAEKAEPEWYYGVDVHMCKRFYHRCEVRPSEFNIPLYLHPPSAEIEAAENAAEIGKAMP